MDVLFCTIIVTFYRFYTIPLDSGVNTHVLFKAYRFRLYPTEAQKVLLSKTFGCCRYVYNRALALKTALYQQEKRGISVFEIDKQMTKWKQDEETAWLTEVSAQALQSSLRGLDTAFTRFFKQISAYPNFKSKHCGHQSFSNPQGTRIDPDSQRVVIPRFKEGIRCAISQDIGSGTIKTSTVSRTPSGKHYISILVEHEGDLPAPPAPTEARTLGLDLGIKSYLTDSTGTKVDNPRTLARHLKRLRRAQRRLSRRTKVSANRDKARHRVALIHERISNIRSDFLHKLTRRLVDNQDYDSFAIEDLAVQNMMETGSRSMSRSIGDASWAEFRRQLTYKTAWKGKNVLVIGRFEPSSRTCDRCGQINRGLTLADRTWMCSCGAEHDRDILAARNIRRFAFCEQNTQSVPLAKRDVKPVESRVTGSTKQEDIPALGLIQDHMGSKHFVRSL